MKFTLVILTLNEIDGVRELYKKLPLKGFDEVFAVDGGSTDGTLEFFKKHGLKVLPQRSKGRGEAFRLAVERAKGDVLVFFSPDGNEDPKDLLKFKKSFEKTDYDLVIASRMMKGAHNEEDVNFFKWRKWANNVFNLLANLFFRRDGPYVTDSINGFRAIKKAKFKELKLDGPGYTIEYQMTIRALKKGFRIFEFPTYEAPRIGGESYAKSIPTGIRFLKLLVQEVLKR